MLRCLKQGMDQPVVISDASTSDGKGLQPGLSAIYRYAEGGGYPTARVNGSIPGVGWCGRTC
jgi:hypothetical protein